MYFKGHHIFPEKKLLGVMHISSAIPGRGTPGIGGENCTKYSEITLFFGPGYRGKFATLQKSKDSEVKYKFHSFLTRRL